MSKIFGVGNDGQRISWQNTTFYKTIADPNSHAPNDATIRWYTSVTGLTYSETVTWQAWIVVSGLQNELESLQKSIQDEIKYGYFRIIKNNYEYPSQSAEYKALYELNADFLTRKEEIRLLILAGKLDLDFSASPVSGTKPLTVSFTNLSEYADYYGWDFTVDGTIDSTAENPTHIYTNAGTFSVKLSGNNESGVGSITKNNYITVYEPPSANFSFSPSAGEPPVLVQFTNLSQDAYRYEWDFDGDDIADSEEVNPSYTYTSANGTGFISVGLSAYNRPGTRNAKQQRFELVGLPVASLAGSLGSATSGWNYLDGIIQNEDNTNVESWDIYWENIDGEGPTPDFGWGIPFNYGWLASAGTYPIQLTTYNKLGTSAYDSTFVTIRETPLAYMTGFSITSAGTNPNMVRRLDSRIARVDFDGVYQNETWLSSDQRAGFFDINAQTFEVWFKATFFNVPDSSTNHPKIFVLTNDNVKGDDLYKGIYESMGVILRQTAGGSSAQLAVYIENSGSTVVSGTITLNLNQQYYLKIIIQVRNGEPEIYLEAWNNEYYSYYWPDGAYNFSNVKKVNLYYTHHAIPLVSYRYMQIMNKDDWPQGSQYETAFEIRDMRFNKHYSDALSGFSPPPPFSPGDWPDFNTEWSLDTNSEGITYDITSEYGIDWFADNSGNWEMGAYEVFSDRDAITSNFTVRYKWSYQDTGGSPAGFNNQQFRLSPFTNGTLAFGFDIRGPEFHASDIVDFRVLAEPNTTTSSTVAVDATDIGPFYIELTAASGLYTLKVWDDDFDGNLIVDINTTGTTSRTWNGLEIKDRTGGGGPGGAAGTDDFSFDFCQLIFN